HIQSLIKTRVFQNSPFTFPPPPRLYTLSLPFTKELTGMERFFVFLILLASCMAQQPQAKPASNAGPAPKTTYIRAGRLFDATADTMRQSVVIVVSGERIQGVGDEKSDKYHAGAY